MVRLRRKQNQYPVLFLSNGETDRYVPYKDPRTQSVDMAKYTALFSDILVNYSILLNTKYVTYREHILFQPMINLTS